MLEPRIAAVTRCEPGAWTALEPLIDRRLRAIFAEPRWGTLPEERRRALHAEVIARLRDADHHRLRLYLAAVHDRPALSLTAWLRVVAKRVRIDYLRGALRSR